MGFRVSGRPNPETVNPLPLTVAPLTDTAADPVDVRVIDCVAGVFNPTLPKARVEALTLSVGPFELLWAAALSCKGNVSTAPSALADNVTVSDELNEEIVAVKVALLASSGTVTVAGTVTRLLSLDRFTTNPPPGAPAFSANVQLFVPAALIDPVAQVSPLSRGGAELVCTGTFNARAKVSATPPLLAVNVTVCVEENEDTVAAKLTLLAPAGTVKVAGSVTALSLLARLTANPPLAAAALKATVH